MITRVVVLAIILQLVACTPRMIAPLCNFTDFGAAEYDHLIEQLPPVTVVELWGRLKVRPRDVAGGIWPSGLDARIELHGPDGFREFIEPGNDGVFVRRGLPSGAYCYKLSAAGFRSMMGTVVIDRSVHRDAPFEIELIIAE